MESFYRVTRSGKKINPKESFRQSNAPVVHKETPQKSIAKLTKPSKTSKPKDPLCNDIREYFSQTHSKNQKQDEVCRESVEDKKVAELKRCAAQIISNRNAGKTVHQKFAHLVEKNKTSEAENLVSTSTVCVEPVIAGNSSPKLTKPKLSEISGNVIENTKAVKQSKACESGEKSKTVAPKPRVSNETMNLIERAKKIEARKAAKLLAHQKYDHLAKDLSKSPIKKLPLPLCLEIIFQIFKSCETIVSMLHNRKEMIYFESLRSHVEKIVKKKFTEDTLNKILDVYPNCYFLRYEQEQDKRVKKHTGGYTLILQPNLRTDSTDCSLQSPSKGHIVFSGSRLQQRKDEFHSRLLNRVYNLHREFLLSLGVESKKIPANEDIKRWHPKFKLDSIDINLTKSRLPLSPAKLERRLTSAKDAVQLFKARALFKEASFCEKLANQCETENKDEVKFSEQIPMASLLDQMVESKCEKKDEKKTCEQKSTSALVGISTSLIAKIRAKENERRLLTLTKGSLSPTKEEMYAKIPEIVTQIYLIMRSSNNKPVSWSSVAAKLAVSCKSGRMTIEKANEFIKLLFEVQPKSWLENLDWKVPYIRLNDSSLELKAILDSVKSKIDDKLKCD